MKTSGWTLLLAAPVALAAAGIAPATAADNNPASNAVTNGPAADARDTLQEAMKVVQKLRADKDLAPKLAQARGVFIVPNFARAAAGVGIKGGEGVLLSRNNGQWSNPAFYNTGSLSVGPQVGASGGQVAFLLMTDKAAKVFDETNNFSLNANAGLSIVNYSARAQASAGKGEDVIAWSDTEGLFAGANIGINDIVADNDENHAFYGSQQADAQAILKGKVAHTPPAAQRLKVALSGRNARTRTSGAGTENASPHAADTANGGSSYGNDNDRYGNAGSSGTRAPRTDRH